MSSILSLKVIFILNFQRIQGCQTAERRMRSWRSLTGRKGALQKTKKKKNFCMQTGVWAPVDKHCAKKNQQEGALDDS